MKKIGAIAHPNGSTVLITGSAKRVGAEIALYLAAQGFSIALHYHRSKKAAEILAKQIKEIRGDCTIFRADLANANEVQRLIPTVHQKCPNFRVLINSASIFEKATLAQSDIKNLDQNFAIHLKAPLILSRQFAKICKTGVIINILETHIVHNQTPYFDYLLSKKSLAALTKMAAVELAPDIRVNAIAPGLILAPPSRPRGHLERLAKKVPLKRKGNPTDIARAAHFLIENDYITGQTIFVDGGEHLL